MSTDKQNNNQPAYRLFLIIAMSTSIVLVSPVLMLLVVGYFVDNFFHTTPLYMFLGIGIGFVSGIINVFRMVQLMQKRKKL